jgi:uncharacterized glyoxalase superfamily protein PhnB
MVATRDEVDEQALIEAARADPARFLDLYDRHFHRVYVYVLRRVRNRTDAEDVTSEVFHRALANLHKYEWRGIPFVAWLYRIAAHELADRSHESARAAGDPPPNHGPAERDFERQGAQVEMRHEAGGHVAHSVLRLYGAAVEIGEGAQPGLGAPAAFIVSVDDCDAVYRRALAAGATSLSPPTKQKFGGWMGGVTDAWGNEWYIASPGSLRRARRARATRGSAAAGSRPRRVRRG